MAEANYQRCQFFLLRYTPNLIRDESVNIGVFFYHPAERELKVRLTDNFRRVKRLHPWADVELLARLEEDFAAQIETHVTDLGAYVAKLQETLSNVLQVTEPKGVLAPDPAAEFDRLFDTYVREPRYPGRAAAALEGGRAWIRNRMVSVFRRLGILGKLEPRVSVEEFTYPSDRFRLDYGYRRNGTRGFLHALSLGADPAQAKILAYTMERVRAKLRAAEMTTINEIEPAADNDAHQFVSRILAEQEIGMVPIARLEEWAEPLRQMIR
jgi:hypothetical protein